MRIGLWIFFIASALIYHIYTEGKLLKQIQAVNNKKNIQIACVVVGALFLYWLVTKHPGQAKEIVETSHAYMKYMPLDSETTSAVKPVIDFTSRFFNESISGGGGRHADLQEQRIISSGIGHTHKRSVSETKKKYIASQQQWQCIQCKQMLSHVYEIDHRVALEDGGDNSVQNLIAMCRECHGQKTAISKL